MARVIGIVSGKGGVGKTVVAINLAAAISKLFQKKVLIVDCNITTSHLGLYLGLYSTPITLNYALKGRVSIHNTIYNHSSGIDIIPASLRLEDLKRLNWRLLKKRLHPILKEYDFIFLDSSPGFNRESLITLDACDEILLVTTPIVHILVDTLKCKQLSEEFNVPPLGVALNMVRNKKYELNKEEVNQMTELNVLCSIPYDDKVIESVTLKMPVVNMRSKVNKEFKKLAKSIVGEEPKEKGLLEKLANMFRWI